MTLAFLAVVTVVAAPFLVTLIVGHLAPLVTALLTHVEAPSTLKQFVTAVLSALTGFLTTATTVDGSAVFSAESALFALLTFITANASYVAVWRKHAIDAKILPSKGLGAPS